MAAGSEGYVDTRGDSTFLKDSIGGMISKVLAAKVLADNERKFAQKKALEQGIDEAQFNAMAPPGFFFKKALVGEFGGFAIKKKKQELAALYRKALLLGKVTKNKKLRGRVVNQLKQSLIYSKANLKNAKRFRSQFDYNDYDDYLAPQSEKIPSTRKKTKSAIDRGGKRVSREQIIESIDTIAKSIERTAQAITQSSSSVYGTLITSNQLQADVAQDLKVRNTTLEDKLQSLVDVISKQTQLQKDIQDKNEDKQQEKQLENKTVSAGAETPDDLTTKEDESRTYSTFADETEMMDAYLQQPPEVSPVNSMVNDLPSMEANGFPKAEKGGKFTGGSIELHGTEALIPSTGAAKIVSGPDSGYPYEIDKPSEVIPIDNNYTQGEKSAVTGKVEPKPEPPLISSPEPKLPSISSPEINASVSSSNIIKPQNSVISSPSITGSNINIQKPQEFEFGTENNFNETNFSNAININTDATQPLIDAANLLPMAAGGGTIAMTSQYLNSMGDSGDEIKPLIDQNARALSSVFGLSSTIVNRATGSKTAGKEKETTEKEEENKDMNKKSLFEKMKEGFGKFMELLGETLGNAAGGGGGGGGGSGDGSGAGASFASSDEQQLTEALVAGEEGVRTEAYQDSEGIWTIGYGQTSLNGRAVKQGDKITKEQALSGFRSNVASHRQRAINQIGEERWGKLEPRARAVLTSLAYNYGSIPAAVLPAAKNGSTEDIAKAMDKLYGHNRGILKGRRQREQAILRGGTSDRLDKDFLAGGKLAAASSGPALGGSPVKPATPVAGNPPGALATGQRPDKSLTTEQWKVQQQALQEASAMGLTGAAKDKYVAEKVMAVPSAIFQRPQPQQPSSIFEMSSAPKTKQQPQIIALNTPAPARTSSAGSSSPTNAQTATVDRGSNPLKGSGLYIEIG